MRSVALLFILFMLGGCTPKFGVDNPPLDQKIFEEEDQLIIGTIIADEVGDFNTSAHYFETLYLKAHKDDYLLEHFKRLYHQKEYEVLLRKLRYYLEEAPQHVELLRFYVGTLNTIGDYDTAKTYALKLLQLTKDPQDYQLVASIYLQKNNFVSALKYLESAYAIHADEAILTDMTTIMYLKLAKKKEAISYLETHSRIYGCSIKVCEKLSAFYSDMDDTAGYISTNKRLYKATQEPQYGQSIVKAYAYNRDTYHLISFLEESGFDDALLLRIYMSQKEYEKSIGLSSKLYEQTQDRAYQAQYAIALYERNSKPSKKVIREVVHNLKEVVQTTPEAGFLNYLGYLLIDHEINIKEGIAYVNQALELETNSGFYLDSLAWGYYKLRQCSKALKTIQKARKAIPDNPEIEAHFRAIKTCK